MHLDSSQDILSFISTCHLYHSLISQDSFWRDLISRKFNIKYRSPSQSWYHQLVSDNFSKMCSHIYPIHLHTILEKQVLLWQSFCIETSQLCCQHVQFDNYGLCMEPHCYFVGCGDVFFEPEESYPGHLRAHHHSTKHNVVLKMSPLNFLELWCYSCNNPVSKLLN